MATIRLLVDSRVPGICRSRKCLATIDWYRTLSDRAMPMNAGAKPERVEADPATGAAVGFFDLSDTHWATCPASKQFARGKRR